MKELQERRFTEQLNEFLPEPFTLKMDIGVDGVLKTAKLNTKEVLNTMQLGMLLHVATTWHLTINLKRSGAGVSILFKNLSIN